MGELSEDARGGNSHKIPSIEYVFNRGIEFSKGFPTWEKNGPFYILLQDSLKLEGDFTNNSLSSGMNLIKKIHREGAILHGLDYVWRRPLSEPELVVDFLTSLVIESLHTDILSENYDREDDESPIKIFIPERELRFVNGPIKRRFDELKKAYRKEHSFEKYIKDNFGLSNVF